MDVTINAHPRSTDRLLAVTHESGTSWLDLGSSLTLFPPRDDAAAWLRRLATVAEDLAEQIDLTASHDEGAALAEKHMAEAMAAAGIARDRRAELAS